MTEFNSKSTLERHQSKNLSAASGEKPLSESAVLQNLAAVRGVSTICAGHHRSLGRPLGAERSHGPPPRQALVVTMHVARWAHSQKVGGEVERNEVWSGRLGERGKLG